MVYMYALVAPDSGFHSVVVTTTGGAFTGVAAASYSNVEQALPANFTTSTSFTSVSNNITIQGSASWLASMMGANFGNLNLTSAGVSRQQASASRLFMDSNAIVSGTNTVTAEAGNNGAAFGVVSVELKNATGSLTPPPPPPPPLNDNGGGNGGKEVVSVVTTDVVNVRAGAGINSKKIGTQLQGASGVLEGKPYPAPSSQSGQYYKVDFTTGVDGWVDSSLLQFTVTSTGGNPKNTIAQIREVLDRLESQLRSMLSRIVDLKSALSAAAAAAGN
jgi:hypothetical protein